MHPHGTIDQDESDKWESFRAVGGPTKFRKVANISVSHLSTSVFSPPKAATVRIDEMTSSATDPALA